MMLSLLVAGNDTQAAMDQHPDQGQQSDGPARYVKQRTGTYLPGRDASKLLDIAGWTIALLALIGVLIHGSLRIISSNKKG